MVRRISTSQLQSQLREYERRRRQAFDRINQEIRRRNDNARRAVQDLNRAIDRHNSGVRSHNSRVMANRQRLRSALNALANLSRRPVATRYVTFRASVQAVNTAYVRLERHPDARLGPDYDHLVDLSERETANSVEVINSLLGDAQSPDGPADELVDARLTDELRRMSPDLDARWQGAVYALNPRNPDAARHFCTSAREIITHILDTRAPDAQVVELVPDCPRTPEGTPTRRAKVRFFLQRGGIQVDALEDFVEQDMENIVQLFRLFNDGTHGSAGTFNLRQLGAIRKRVEDAIFFLSRLVV